jgi:hypothetical protein
MGASGIDVLLSPAASKKFPWAVECKSHARMAVYSFYEQAQANETESLRPLVVIRANHKKPLVVLSLDDFMRIYENQQNN